MASFDEAIPLVLEHEGGLSEDPNDPGGITNFGISLRWHPELGAGGIRNLTRDQAVAIYRATYWNAFFEALSSQELANKVFDFYVNNRTQAIQILRDSLGPSAAPLSLLSLAGLANTSSPDKLIAEYRARMALFYHRWLLKTPAAGKDALGLFRRAIS